MATVQETVEANFSESDDDLEDEGRKSQFQSFISRQSLNETGNDIGNNAERNTDEIVKGTMWINSTHDVGIMNDFNSVDN